MSAIRGLSDNRLPLLDLMPMTEAEQNLRFDLPAMTKGRQVVEDYRSVGLSLRRSSVGRSCAPRCGSSADIVRCADLAGTARRRAPGRWPGSCWCGNGQGSARGVLFVTIEDENGHANLIVWPSVFETHRRFPAVRDPCWPAAANCKRKASVIHVIADQITDLSGLLRSVGDETRAMRVPTRDFR